MQGWRRVAPQSAPKTECGCRRHRRTEPRPAATRGDGVDHTRAGLSRVVVRKPERASGCVLSVTWRVSGACRSGEVGRHLAGHAARLVTACARCRGVLLVGLASETH
eukprot:scaffold16112_cov63-Phaeocystis_antarctica.AAC.3